jgi:predicted O-linked N-acetylglucosamine transferase (SPINDLY family)
MSPPIDPPTNTLHMRVKKMYTLLSEVEEYKEQLLEEQKVLDAEFELMKGMSNNDFALWRQKHQLAFIDKWEERYNRIIQMKAFL